MTGDWTMFTGKLNAILVPRREAMRSAFKYGVALSRALKEIVEHFEFDNPQDRPSVCSIRSIAGFEVSDAFDEVGWSGRIGVGSRSTRTEIQINVAPAIISFECCRTYSKNLKTLKVAAVQFDASDAQLWSSESLWLPDTVSATAKVPAEALAEKIIERLIVFDIEADMEAALQRLGEIDH